MALDIDQQSGEDWTVLPHVPPELVVDIDIFDIPGGHEDPATAWRSYQGKGPIVFSPRFGGYWVVACAEDMPKLYRDTEHLSNRQVTVPHFGDDVLLPIQADPPMHAKYRSVINPLLSKQAVEARSPAVRELTVSLIEEFRQRGECEFVTEFTLKFPLTIFMNMMGLPIEDLAYLRRLVVAFSTTPDSAVKMAANAEMTEYLDRQINDRISNPRNDGVTHVTRGKIDDRPMTRAEMLATCSMLLQAGLDTVANMLAFTVRHLASHPEQRQYIRENHDKMHTIVQEFLRRFPVATIGRVVAKDWIYRGVELKKGEPVILPLALFNLDPDRLENPDAVDLTRNAQNITFGSGRHTCAGAVLARKEMSIFLEEWLARIPEFEVDTTRPLRMVAGTTNAVHELWLKWPILAA